SPKFLVSGVPASQTVNLTYPVSPCRAEIVGTVMSRDRTPVPGAQLVLAVDPGEQREEGDVTVCEFPARRGVTDHAGRYAFRGVPPGKAWLCVKGPGTRAVRESVLLRDGDSLVKDVICEAGVTVRGVVRAANGDRVEGAMIRNATTFDPELHESNTRS